MDNSVGTWTHSWSYVSRVWQHLGLGYKQGFNAKQNHTAVVSSPAASRPTAVVTDPQDLADQHWVGVDVQAYPTHVQVGRGQGCPQKNLTLTLVIQ